MRLHRPLGGMLALALALSLPISGFAADAPKADGDGLFPVELATLMTKPQSLLGAKVKFRCTFAAVTDLFDFHRTSFRPERFAAIAIWDDRAKLWQPEARAAVITTVFIPKDRITPTRSTSLQKYQPLELAGVVKDVVEGVPQIEILEVRPVSGGQFSDVAIYHVEQALALITDGVRDLAEEHFASALTTDLPLPAQVEIAMLRGGNLIDSGRFAEATSVLSKAVAQAGQDVDMLNPARAQLYALLAKGQSELAERTDAGQRQSAVDNARKALTYDPANGEAYAVLGIGLAGLGQFDEARRNCDNAVRLRPADAEVRWYLGRILDQQGRNDEAIDALKKAIDLTPKDFRIHKAIAGAYHHRGIKGGPSAGQDLFNALREYDITLRLNPGDSDVIVSSGQVIEDAAKAGGEIQVGSTRQPATRELALGRYKSAIQLNDKSVAAWRALGLFEASSGHPAEAKVAADKLISLGATAEAAEVLKGAPAGSPKPAGKPTAEPSPLPAAEAQSIPAAMETPAPEAQPAAAPVEGTVADPSLPAQPAPEALPTAEPLPAAPAP